MEETRRYNVGVVKVPHADRDVARSVMGDSGEGRGFVDVIGADTRDDDDEFPIGSPCTYAVHLTEDEVEQFRSASNCRYVEPDGVMSPMVTSIAEPQDMQGMATATAPGLAGVIPSTRTWDWLRANFDGSANHHGRDVPIAVLDQGTTSAVRRVMGHRLVARRIFSATQPKGEIHSTTDTVHGCLVAPNAVPYGGLLIDGLISEADGGATFTGIASGMRWATDMGAKLVNLSFGGPNGSEVFTDALDYMLKFDCQFYAAAGNSGQPFPAYPAAYSAVYSNCHSIIAWDDATDTPATFTNYSGGCSGCAPGVRVNSLTPAGQLTQWSGTSAASPHALLTVARLMTRGRLTAAQASKIMEENLRQTGAGAYQGGGAWQLLQPLAASITQYGTGAGSTGAALLCL